MPFDQLLAIPIPFNPNISGGTGFALSWHGFLSFIAVATAVFFVARAARSERLDADMVYNLAVYAIVGGIIGARLVHVADNWDIYGSQPGRIIAIWEGGIGLWGGILGGWLAGAGYAYFAGYPVGKLMDITAAPMLISQTIGRVGDIINGEHWSRATDLPWGWYFTDPSSPGRTGAQRFLGDPEAPAHPAVVYEMIWNILGLFIMYKLRNRLRPNGSLWMVYLAYYSVGRFAIQFVRLDKVYFASLQEAHLIAIGVLAISVPFLVIKTRLRKPGDDAGQGPGDDGGEEMSAAQRRRQRRQQRRERAQQTGSGSTADAH